MELAFLFHTAYLKHMTKLAREGMNESSMLQLTLAPITLLFISSSGTPRLVGNFFDFSVLWECLP
jgi:hypothetical protein